MLLSHLVGSEWQAHASGDAARTIIAMEQRALERWGKGDPNGYIERAEMIDPKVQQRGDVAVLTFNLVSHGARFGDGPKGDVRWNSTEVYQRISGRWKIVHSHWSYTKPELKEKPAE